MVKSEAITYCLAAYLAFAVGFMKQAAHEEEALSVKDQEISRLQSKLREYESVAVVVSAYTACVEECDSDPEHAVIGRPIAGWTCAVSRDRRYMLGKIVYVPDAGRRLVNDLLPEGRTNSLDLCVGTKSEAFTWGRRKKRITISA